MDLTLLPPRTQLDKANNDSCRASTSARSTGSFTARVFVLLLGLALRSRWCWRSFS